MHVVGSKYVDFFTDGTTIFSFPGDPSIDANLNKPNAPIPTHAGLTWVSTKAMEAYDTPSGDLESGTYAQEANGSFIPNTSGSSAARRPPPSLPSRYSTPRSTPARRLPLQRLQRHPSLTPPLIRQPQTPASTTSPLPDTSATASSTPDASTTTSASSTTAASVASTTPTIASATSTATSTAASSSVASSSSAAANDNAASTTATQ